MPLSFFSKFNREALFGGKKLNKSFSILTILLVVSVFTVFLFPVTLAATYTVSFSSTPDQLQALYNDVDALAYVQTVRVPDLGQPYGYVTDFRLDLVYKVGAPDATIHCAIIGNGNALHGAPNGTTIATSQTTYQATSLSTSTSEKQSLTFEFDNVVVPSQGYIGIKIYIDSVSTNASNYVKFDGKGTSATYSAGNLWRTISGTWTEWASPLRSFAGFALHVETTLATPTPTPQPSSYLYWNGTVWVNYIPATPEPNIFENGVAAPYIQMMVPIIILAAAALLGYKFAGAWGFFAGLNIGAILSYMILGSSVFPLWGIVALLVIDGLLLFGKIGIRS